MIYDTVKLEHIQYLHIYIVIASSIQIYFSKLQWMLLAAASWKVSMPTKFLPQWSNEKVRACHSSTTALFY